MHTWTSLAMFIAVDLVVAPGTAQAAPVALEPIAEEATGVRSAIAMAMAGLAAVIAGRRPGA